jgi:plastocyanin
MKRQLFLASLIASMSLATGLAQAQADQIVLTIKNNTFSPKEIKIPAGKKVKLIVVNEDPTPAEFESKSLGREKIVPAKSKITVNVGPLKPGRYDFVEEYHEKEPGAQGVIVVE